ncbi:hypothetical protein RRG08_030305 [Elysia crispata]|uniref:Uncharacterized protein n=1 Tax=Elysia crispata TaxID=231223 RepID=A0AAE0YIK2_9GAST|nr:hypothetical protein RRG08_030305 [Elysia crispata]
MFPYQLEVLIRGSKWIAIVMESVSVCSLKFNSGQKWSSTPVVSNSLTPGMRKVKTTCWLKYYVTWLILPRLAGMAASNNQTGNQTKRSDIAGQLFEAYSALSCCSLSEQLIAEALLPGLRCLLLDMEALGEAHMQEVVSAMVKDYQSRLEARSQAPLSTDDLKATVMSRIKDTNISNIFTRKK